MAHTQGAEGVLATLAQGLQRDADEFTPAATPTAHRDLPGRQRGAALSSVAQGEAQGQVRGAAAVVLDCGTSRHDGYTHVLWVSPSAESILGSHVSERLGEAVGSIDGVERWTWEGLDRLHVRAPGTDWDHLIDAARAAVIALARG